MLKIGDQGMWRGGFGAAAPRLARIVSMELCEHERGKYGKPVLAADLEVKNRLVVDLDNGAWAYGSQIEVV
jgi:hypothetical protein